MPPYKLSNAVDCNIDFNTSRLAGKTAIVTGGAKGLGEAYVRALLAEGVHVVVGDLDVIAGEKLVSELGPKARFQKCNTAVWEDQIGLFEAAIDHSPNGKIHYVVANAGIIRNDEVFSYEEVPKKPDLLTLEVNIIGTMYTTKLATHYFVKQNGESASDQQEDTCLVLVGSGAAFLDCLRIPQYSASKWAARGIMHALRRTAYHYGSRVNVISPWYVKTSILSDADFENVKKQGVELATVEDAGQCLLRILSDTTVNGRSLFIAPRKWSPRGYLDLDIDDYHDDLIQEIMADQLKGGEVEKLFLNQYKLEFDQK